MTGHCNVSSLTMITISEAPSTGSTCTLQHWCYWRPNRLPVGKAPIAEPGDHVENVVPRDQDRGCSRRLMKSTWEQYSEQKMIYDVQPNCQQHYRTVQTNIWRLLWANLFAEDGRTLTRSSIFTRRHRPRDRASVEFWRLVRAQWGRRTRRSSRLVYGAFSQGNGDPCAILGDSQMTDDVV